MSTYVAISTYNRRALAEQCIPTVAVGLSAEDELIVYDDGSTEFNIGELSLGATGVKNCPSIGIDAQRRIHILDFWERAKTHGHDFLYMTDSDAPHDPSWLEAAHRLHYEHDGAPLCLYRTATHASYHNNVYRDDENESVLWQRFIPGVSYFLSLAHVAKIREMIPERWAFDWQIPSILDYKMAVSRVSYCDHIGHLGMHDTAERGFVSPERATNPTPWLVNKRREILSNLGLKDA
jgi:hypothetical protein